jgi:hypothetical protein
MDAVFVQIYSTPRHRQQHFESISAKKKQTDRFCAEGDKKQA